MTLCSLLLPSNLGPESWPFQWAPGLRGLLCFLVQCELSWKENVCQGATVPSPAPLSGLSQSLPQSFQTSQDCGNALSTQTFAALPATFVCYYKSHIRHSQTPRGQTTAICPPMILLDTSRTTQTVNGQGRHLCVAWQAGGGSVPCGTYLPCPPLSEIPV